MGEERERRKEEIRVVKQSGRVTEGGWGWGEARERKEEGGREGGRKAKECVYENTGMR